ncbi:MAG: response regulator transcription factor [Pseudomonadota bacterium]
MSLRILVVDDHPLFLAGIQEVLADLAAGVLTVREANNAASALDLLERESPFDWIYLDLNLPDKDGMNLLSTIHTLGLDTPVVVISGDDDPNTVDSALKAGACGFVSKASTREELLEAFRAINRGDQFISNALRAPLAEFRLGTKRPRRESIRLTRRQREVLNLLAKGFSNAAIADALGLSVSTVKSHVSTLFEALGVDNRAGCTRAALRLGLID